MTKALVAVGGAWIDVLSVEAVVPIDSDMCRVYLSTSTLTLDASAADVLEAMGRAFPVAET